MFCKRAFAPQHFISLKERHIQHFLLYLPNAMQAKATYRQRRARKHNPITQQNSTLWPHSFQSFPSFCYSS